MERSLGCRDYGDRSHLKSLEPAAVAGQFLMQVFTPEAIKECPANHSDSSRVLGNSLVLDLEEFPELNWLPACLAALHALHNECDRISCDIQAIAQAGDIYHDQWIEPYTKTKNGKQYSYYQLRWLTGERKKSGQPKIKTKHLSHKAVSEVRSAIARENQVEAFEKRRQQVEAEIEQLRHLVRGTERRLQRAISQNFNIREGNCYEP